jgi:membrane protein YdbS with pleckstrin-like domain
VSESDSVADGQDHSLDPRVIPMQRTAGGLVAAGTATVALVGISIALLAADDMPGWLQVLLPALWLVLVLLLATSAYRWPAHHYPYTSYLVDDLGIEIRKGVYWRVVINVPKSRVQHIDVSQGPIERRHGLGTLVIYTAGTDHARVTLAGLEHGRALRLREHLLPSGAGDAV